MLFEEANSKSNQDAQSTISRSDNHRETYVMHGLAAERTVTTYHLILAPTHACNLRCEHCYLPDHAVHAVPKEIALRLLHEWNEIAAEETPGRRGIFHVKGGEPLVYKPLLAMLDAIRNLPNLHFMMTTNGTLFRKPHWKALSDLNEVSDGAVTVVVSLDGASAATHQLLRGEDSFEPTMRTLRGLQARGVRTYINCVLHVENIHELDAMVALAMDLGVAQLNFLPFVPKGYGQEMRHRQLPHRVAFEKLYECYRKLPEGSRRLLAGSLPHIVARENAGTLVAAHECVAAYRGLIYIKPDGHAFTCPNLEAKEFSIGSVYKDTLKTLLDRVAGLYLRLHHDQRSDRHICMGERKLYESERNLLSQDSLNEMKALAESHALTMAKGEQHAPVSFCVSRNW